MEPEKLMESISKEIKSALRAMQKATLPEEKLKHSEIIKNLCDSQNVFLGLIAEMSAYEDDDILF